jgi:hypothetical protein
VQQYSSANVLCSGEGLAGITAATFENSILTIHLETDKKTCKPPPGAETDQGKCLHVFLSRQVTKKPGPVEVLLHTKDDKTILPLAITVQPATPPATQKK